VTGAVAFCVIWALRYYPRHPFKVAMRRLRRCPRSLRWGQYFRWVR
jgi:hypothetical protein